jgi:hypothetical protein
VWGCAVVGCQTRERFSPGSKTTWGIGPGKRNHFGLPNEPDCWDRSVPIAITGIFLYLFYRDFAKIYGLSKILQKYISGVVAHAVRDITSWAAALGAIRIGP